MYFWVPSNYFNHAEGTGVNVTLQSSQNAEVHVVATRDIRAGEELYQDYRSFRLPAWYRAFCDEQGVVDAQRLGLDISGPDGSDVNSALYYEMMREIF